MAAFDTYLDLQATVADWLNRPDLSDQVKTFIRLGEARFGRELKWLKETYSLISMSNLPLTVDDTPFALPAYVRRPTAFWSVGTPYLGPIDIVSAEEWRKLVHSNRDASGTPRKGVLQFNSSDGLLYLSLWPRPATSLDIDFDYYRAVTPLATDNDTNPILATHPDLYLYAALAESAPFLQHDERLPVWEARYTDIIKKMNFEREEIERGARPFRTNLKKF